MDAIGNVPERGTLHHLDYDLVTGQPTGGDLNTVQNLRLVREQYVVEKMDDIDALRRSRQYRVVGSDLNGVQPQEDDTIEVGGETWTIRLVDPDPVGASLVLHVRR